MPSSDSRSQIDQAIRRAGLACDWPKDVAAELTQCEKLSAAITATKDRINLSALPFVTIDSATAKDFDDAIYCHKRKKSTALWVAIADVASYVRTGSKLDMEAFKRGNSTYLPDRVLPMLPPLLADNLCSLLPCRDRPVTVCRMVFDEHARMLSYRFDKAVIRSQRRLTYQQVQDFFDRGSSSGQYSTAISSMLQAAKHLYATLLKSRKARGALDLELSHRSLQFDKYQCIKAVVSQTRNDAHRMIEEFMICANVAAARYLSGHDAVFLRRVHGGVKREALPALKNFLYRLGFHLSGTEATDLSHLAEQTSQHAKKQIIHTMILSVLQRAIYAPLEKGHFGLALENYTHFTSPIRRYPDLLVHRAIHATLGLASGHRYSAKVLLHRGQHCSTTERRSDETVWDVEQYFLCVLAQRKIGQAYNGMITAVLSFGLIVDIKDLQTSGLLHIKYLQRRGYCRFDPTHPSLISVRSGKSYRVGDTIRFVIESVQPERRKINLVLANR